MKEENISQVLRSIVKSCNPDEDVCSHLINFYFTHYYCGTELDKVSLLYMDYVYSELILWLIENRASIKKGYKNITKINNLFNKRILYGKIKTHKKRLSVFHHWLGGKGNINNNKLDPYYNELFELMLQIHPNIKDIEFVRADLGLKETKNELKSLYKGLNNVR